MTPALSTPAFIGILVALIVVAAGAWTGTGILESKQAKRLFKSRYAPV
jgi:hypothetical protein